MEHKSYRTQIKGILTEFCDTLTAIEVFSKEYNCTFSSHLKTGTISLNEDTKDVVISYFKYISNVTNTLYAFENSLSCLAKLMVEAERACDESSISVCDSMLNDYNNIKNDVSTFIKKCEIEISKSKGAPTLSAMSNLFEQIQRKFFFTHEHISSFLKSYEV